MSCFVNLKVSPARSCKFSYDSRRNNKLVIFQDSIFYQPSTHTFRKMERGDIYIRIKNNSKSCSFAVLSIVPVLAARGTVCHDHRDENGSCTLAHWSPDRSDPLAHEKFRAKSDRLLAFTCCCPALGGRTTTSAASLQQTWLMRQTGPSDATSTIRHT